MAPTDYFVLTFYVVGILVVGVVLAARNKSSDEMFAAGGQSPWWVSGLSGFMTMFSAGTFVVWGGIAYKYGLVAVAINLCYGVAALLVGYTVAGRWKECGVRTPAEFIETRYGAAALHFYTWTMMLFRIVTVAVALYSLAIVLVTLAPIPDAWDIPWLSENGNLRLSTAILLFGGFVVLYTMIGGLWGVLMTDVLQFIVLNLAVLFVVPLGFARAGGVATFIDEAPDGFFSLTNVSAGYGWMFLASWVAIHYFVVGAEWAFVQRYICVPSPRDAAKSAYLFGVLYLVSPLLWLLPPMVYRVQSPPPLDATPDELNRLAEIAYIAACQSVLPAGMLGLMFAAMFSATASMVSSQLNVFAGVLTNDIYRPLAGERVTEDAMVWAGRAFTLLIGVALIGVALAVPHLGGAEAVIISATSMVVVSLFAPTVWGLFSRRLKSGAVWVTAAVTASCILAIKLAPGQPWDFLRDVKSVDQIVGTLLPVLVLTGWTLASSGVSPGWSRVTALAQRNLHLTPPTASRAPAMIVAWSLLACGGMIGALAILDVENRGLLMTFAAIVGVLGGGILLASSRVASSTAGKPPPAKAGHRDHTGSASCRGASLDEPKIKLPS